LIAIAGLIVVLGLGGLAGWFRGRFTQISVDPDSHELTSKASPVALVLIAGLFVLRYGLRLYVEQDGAAGSPGRLNAGAAALTDGLLLFSVGVVGVQRLEMWLRARRLLADSIAAKAARTKSATSA
jgi:hypothetical protein